MTDATLAELFDIVAEMDAAKAVQKKTGRALCDLSLSDMGSHLLDEASETAAELRQRDRSHGQPWSPKDTASELGDLLGVMLHIGTRIDITAGRIIRECAAKLLERFNMPEQLRAKLTAIARGVSDATGWHQAQLRQMRTRWESRHDEQQDKQQREKIAEGVSWDQFVKNANANAEIGLALVEEMGKTSDLSAKLAAILSEATAADKANASRGGPGGSVSALELIKIINQPAPLHGIAAVAEERQRNEAQAGELRTYVNDGSVHSPIPPEGVVFIWKDPRSGGIYAGHHGLVPVGAPAGAQYVIIGHRDKLFPPIKNGPEECKTATAPSP